MKHIKLTNEQIDYLNGFVKKQSNYIEYLNPVAKRTEPIKKEYQILTDLEKKLAY